MKAILILCAALLAASCAPNTPAPGGFVKAIIPEKAPDASPVVAEAKKAAAEADTQTEVARVHVTTVTREAATLRQGLEAATAEADRLRLQKSASEAELDGMWRSLQALTARNLFLEEEAAKAAQSLAYEKQLRKAANETFTRAEGMIRQKESEAAALRLQLIDSEASREAIHTTAASLSKAAASSASRADKLAGAIRVHWIGHGIATLTIVCLVAFLFLRPRLI